MKKLLILLGFILLVDLVCCRDGRRNQRNRGRCTQPKEIGRCRGRFLRYYFNTESERCEEFYYGGCHGNGNNFRSMRRCRRICEENGDARLRNVDEEENGIRKSLNDGLRRGLNGNDEPDDSLRGQHGRRNGSRRRGFGRRGGEGGDNGGLSGRDGLNRNRFGGRGRDGLNRNRFGGRGRDGDRRRGGGGGGGGGGSEDLGGRGGGGGGL